ncbi:MAG: zinc dependent phospholipase C family protein, partial [Cyclobacteriaceae bacterium]|nr:zinc dependent phospholipase C family protein [Cyclobacteriaceae bacterium]
FVFYKAHVDYLGENAVNPDKRRYIIPEEGQRHYIDMDTYPDSLLQKMPFPFREIEGLFEPDFLSENGTLPWNLQKVYFQLKEAFLKKDVSNILKYSAESGHYLGDANVPLHTTSNYNGQLTGQYGIHGFWESRLPELFFERYNLFTGKADYLPNTSETIWRHILLANQAVDSVLSLEKKLSNELPIDLKYTYSKRGNAIVKTYSVDYARAYHTLLHGMVERQMKRSVKLVGDFWYTCWVDAGQPYLGDLLHELPRKEPLPVKGSQPFKTRPH